MSCCWALSRVPVLASLLPSRDLWVMDFSVIGPLAADSSQHGCLSQAQEVGLGLGRGAAAQMLARSQPRLTVSLGGEHLVLRGVHVVISARDPEFCPGILLLPVPVTLALAPLQASPDLPAVSWKTEPND